MKIYLQFKYNISFNYLIIILVMKINKDSVREKSFSIEKINNAYKNKKQIMVNIFQVRKFIILI